MTIYHIFYSTVALAIIAAISFFLAPKGEGKAVLAISVPTLLIISVALYWLARIEASNRGWGGFSQ